MPSRAPRRCTTPGCPGPPTPGSGSGKCDVCRPRATRPRPSSTAQGYDTEHQERFRARVLERDPVCTVCGDAPSAHADHYPRPKRELRAAGLDEHHPMYGRGLCHACHSAETAQHQPGGWHAAPPF